MIAGIGYCQFLFNKSVQKIIFICDDEWRNDLLNLWLATKYTHFKWRLGFKLLYAEFHLQARNHRMKNFTVTYTMDTEMEPFILSIGRNINQIKYQCANVERPRLRKNGKRIVSR